MGSRRPTMVALLLGLGAATACSSDLASPTPPSPFPVTATSATPRLEPEPSPAPGLNEPGIQLTAVPREDGSFDVTEVVRLREATSVLRVRPPLSGENLPGLMARTDPRVTDLKVVADGNEVGPDRAEVDQAGDVPLDGPATRLTLTYRLTASTVRSEPSPKGRALSVISPLTAPTDGSLPTTMVVSGGGLLNVACPMLPETRCAVGAPPRIRIRPGIPAEQALAVLQHDLPTRGTSGPSGTYAVLHGQRTA